VPISQKSFSGAKGYLSPRPINLVADPVRNIRLFVFGKPNRLGSTEIKPGIMLRDQRIAASGFLKFAWRANPARDNRIGKHCMFRHGCESSQPLGFGEFLVEFGS